MKKFYFIAAIALAALVACSKDDDNKNSGNSSKTGDDGISIKIDGDFSDWKGDGIVVSELGDEVETSYPNLHVMKACADKKNVYFYFEYELAEDQTVAPIDILINSDNDVTTGFTSWIWVDEACGWDYMIESEQGFLNEAGGIADLSDATIYKCVAGDGQDAWDSGSVMEPQNVEDFIACKGSVKGGVAYFEVSVVRSVINANKTGKLAFGVTMTDATTGDWITTGILPQAEAGGVGGEMLEVKLP